MTKDPFDILDDAIAHANDVTRLMSYLQDVSSMEDRWANREGEMRLVQDLTRQLHRARRAFDFAFKLKAANDRRAS